MGGRLEVETEVGVGSEFSFTIEMPPSESEETMSSKDWSRLRGARILVVDDNPTNRRIVREMLIPTGAIADEADGAETAFAAMREAVARKTPYQLAIIDFYMPGQDGFELARRIRELAEFANTPLMMLTSGGRRGDGERCRSIGISAYLPKPISRSELLEATVALLSKDGPARERGRLITQHSIEEGHGSLHVLLAEDNPVNQEVAVAMLSRRGHRIDVAHNGIEAVEAATATDYDVILMDIQMPELDGIEAMKRIRQIPGKKTPPIVAMTAHALEEERQRFLADGMDGYLAKPFKPHELFTAVEDWESSASEEPPAPRERTPVDVEGLRQTMRDAGVEEVVEKILDLFREDAPKRMGSLEEAASNGNAESISRTAHALKSAAGGIQATDLFEILKRIESEAAKGNADEAVSLVLDARRELDAVDAFLQNLIHSAE